MFFGISYLRAVAALSVFFLHYNYFYASVLDVNYFHFGEFGVDIFFVISGFLISRTIRNSRDFREFFYNRINRVVPLYTFATALLFLKFLLVDGQDTFIRFLQSIIYFPHVKSDGVFQPLLGVGWTLNLEMIFYVLFGSFYFRSVSVWLFLAVFYLVVRLNFYFDFIVLEFLFGVVISKYYHRLSPFYSLPYSLFISFSSIFCIVISDYFWEPSGFSRVFFWGIPSAFLVLGSLGIKKDYFFLMSWVGKISYSIYIWHYFVIQIVSRFFVDPVALLFFSLLITFIVSGASYKFIESRWRIV